MRDFNRDGFPKMRGDWLFTAVPIFIGIVFLLIVGYWVFVAVIASKAMKSLSDCGIPAVVTTNDGHGNQTYTFKCPEKDQTK